MAGPSTAPFQPNSAGTVNIAATSTTGNVALVGNGTEVTISNRGTAGNGIVFVNFGDSTVTAVATTAMPIFPGEVFTVGRDSKITHVAAITLSSSDTATVYFTTGWGS